MYARDGSYDGRFFIAVTTTGVFCRLSCPAPQPKPENVRFYASAAEALVAGFRPCKRCRPLESAEGAPAWAAQLVARVEAGPEARISDADLRADGLDPAAVRRWFQTAHGLSFHAYCRARRLRDTFAAVREGRRASVPPGSAAPIRLAWLETSIGPLLAGATGDAVCLLEFPDRRMIEAQLETLRRRFRRPLAPGGSPLLDLLRDQLDEYQYQGNLHTLRWLVDSYPEDFWTANLYNRWLTALRALNAPTLDPAYPEPMRTAAWADRTTNVQLASWAELRHDTLLYAKQSYTGGISCTYPDGYVEPYPELWAALAAYARDAKAKLADVPFTDPWTRTSIDTYFDGFAATMDRLEALARKELAAEPFDADDVAFLEQVIHMDPGCGDPGYTGWYAGLFWGGSELHKEFAPTIADVHTDANDTGVCGEPCAESPRVLHVGTGAVNLMVFTADSCEGPRAYVGPVSSYYELAPPRELKRWTDSEWKVALGSPQPPERPEWTGSFVVK